MAILIDPPAWPAHGTLFSHLVSNESYAELHAFARQLYIPRRAFDLDHYDVPASLHAQAVSLGARAVSAKDVVHALRDSGLRVRQVDREAVQPVRRKEYLRAEWERLGHELGSYAQSEGQDAFDTTERWRALGEELLDRWNEPHRQYHDERHLEEVLLALDQFETRGEGRSAVALLAAWFHDAVYRGFAGHSGDPSGDAMSDEAESSRLAVARLTPFEQEHTLPDGTAREVRDFILATEPGAASAQASRALLLLLDADLSIFAASPRRYSEYVASIRREYAHMPEAAFTAGRAAILAAYLARPNIYLTDSARTMWEARARANVGAELAALRNGS